MKTPCDIAIVGGGIVGLATAWEMLRRHPGCRVVLLEKEARLATAQTGHNSGVIHSGIYYAPGSLKARMCVAGRHALTAFCDAHQVPYQLCGKLIVARDASELPRLVNLLERARANGVEDVTMLDVGGMKDVEPFVQGIRALHVGCTGIVDYGAVCAALADAVRAAGGDIRLDAPVLDLVRRNGEIRVETLRGDVPARHVIACAGLQSDRLARRAGAPDDLRIVPFRGDYYVIKPSRAYLCRSLIYPVPDPAFPFLGVHFTRRMDGAVWAGPNAVLAFARERYGRWDFDLRDTWETVSYPGTWIMGRRYWRMGMEEMWRDYVFSAYLRTMRWYLPDIDAADVLPGPSGIRAQALAYDGGLVDDFSVYEADRMIHVRNAPSPAATSALGIAGMIADRADARFALGGSGHPGRDN